MDGYNVLVDSAWKEPISGTAMFRVNQKLKKIKVRTKEWLRNQHSMQEQMDNANKELAMIEEELGLEPFPMLLQIKRHKIKVNFFTGKR